MNKFKTNWSDFRVLQELPEDARSAAQSPDLDPPEHLWGHLKTDKSQAFSNITRCSWNIVKKRWDNVDH